MTANAGNGGVETERRAVREMPGHEVAKALEDLARNSAWFLLHRVRQRVPELPTDANEVVAESCGDLSGDTCLAQRRIGRP